MGQGRRGVARQHTRATRDEGVEITEEATNALRGTVRVLCYCEAGVPKVVDKALLETARQPRQ